MPLPPPEEMYQALVDRDRSYEGTFIAGVRTTGIFCRSSCPAKKPKISNVEFFASARDALLAGYRPCLRCRPLEVADAAPSWLVTVLEAVEADPTRRFKDEDLRALGVDPARVRRWFLRQHGLTFQAYSRSRRLGEALSQIRQGEDLTLAGLEHGFESLSGFREAFQRLFGTTPGRAKYAQEVLVNRIQTPLGSMLAAASDTELLLLEFVDRRMLATQITRLEKRTGATFVPGDNEILAATQREIDLYFASRLRAFSVPIRFAGTEFQQRVWTQLIEIPYGETKSYAEQAAAIGRPEAVRAVARANGDNRIAIIIPCHRVVGSDGTLTGYGGQLWRKQALLELEGAVIAQQPSLKLGSRASAPIRSE